MTGLWLMLGGIAVGFAYLLWRLLSPQSPFVISDRGVLDRSQRLGWIPWDEIEGAFPPTAHERDTLCVKVRVSERLARRLRRSRGLRKGEPLPESVEILLDLSGSDTSAVEILQEVIARSRPEGRESMVSPPR